MSGTAAAELALGRLGVELVVPKGFKHHSHMRQVLLTRTAPNTYPLDVPATWRTCAEFNVERLRPYLRRPDHLGGEAAPPQQVIGADGRPEHEVQELLKFDVLVCWAGHDASGDT